ncbi:MAG: MFS transporter [Actinobacteria bacterium]|nr:MFS transporter [Actinomycetota bacterium]
MGGEAVQQVQSVSVREVLTPQITRMLVGVGISSLGGGLIMSLLAVYLHQVRGLPLQLAGLVLTFQAVLGLAVSPVVGLLVDRIGPRPVLLTALGVEAVGTVAIGFVQTAPQAFLAAGIVAVGNAGLWAPQAAILSRLTTPERRQRVFGLQFMLLNLGIGLGGLVGAAVVDVSRPGTFTVLYAANAVTFLAYAVVLLGVRGVSGPEAHAPADDDDGPGGYLQVLRDRRLRRYVLGALVLLTCGYGSMEVGIPVFMTTEAGLPVNAIGIVFFFNTLVIVLAQVWVLKRIEGRSRSRILLVVAVSWSACWLLLAASSLVGPVAAAIIITLGVSVFAVGETLWSPVAPSLVNDFAAPHLRGRYNAVGGLVWSVAGAVGPALAGAMLGAGLGVLWALVVAGGALVAGLVLLSLRTLLTPAEDGRTVRDPVAA